MAKVQEPLIFIEIDVNTEVEEVMEEDIFQAEFYEEEEAEEALFDDEELDCDDPPMRPGETSMQYHSRLNGWKQSDFI
jgi:hypothetical protein